MPGAERAENAAALALFVTIPLVALLVAPGLAKASDEWSGEAKAFFPEHGDPEVAIELVERRQLQPLRPVSSTRRRGR